VDDPGIMESQCIMKPLN